MWACLGCFCTACVAFVHLITCSLPAPTRWPLVPRSLQNQLARSCAVGITGLGNGSCAVLWGSRLWTGTALKISPGWDYPGNVLLAKANDFWYLFKTFGSAFPPNHQMQKLFKMKMFMQGNMGSFNLSPQKSSYTSLCLVAADFTNTWNYKIHIGTI